MKTNKNIFKIMTISIVTLFLFNCSDDVQEDNPLSEDQSLQEDDLSTVPLESTLDFFNSLNTTNRLNRVSGDQNNIGLEIDIASLEQVDISDTDAKLNIANATTKFDNVETQVLQIEIDGTLQTVLFHHIPEDTTATNRSSSRTTGYSFTGSVFTTNLSGTVLSGFRINLGNISGSFNFSTPIYNTDPDPCWGIGCGIDLDEVVITSPSNYAAVNHTTMNNRAYQWGRSNNNYSSMGTAYANYYWQKREIERQKDIEEFYDEIDDAELEGKEECLNNLLKKEGNSFLKNILDKFKGDSEFDIKIQSKNQVYNGTNEVSGKTSYLLDSNIINIEISTSKQAVKPTLGTVRDLIHEYIHADMFRKLYTNYPTQGELDFKTTYEYFKNGNFQASAQHESMASLYVLSMRDALKSFHKNHLTGDYNYLTDNGAHPLPDSFYEAMAWQGLKNHDVAAYNNLPDSKKTELQNSLEANYHETTKNCPN